MSKNITIQEGGTGKQMTVNKLKTNVAGGGTCLWVPEDEASLGTKSITTNGTYKASDDGKYGFSQVTVNVAGGAGSANPDGTPSISGGTPDGSGSPSSGVPSGGSGTSVIGKNPITGNEEAVGVDGNGNLVTTSIPSSIEMVTNPTNTSYDDGDSINLSGAKVIAKNADGSLWTSEDYPNGEIPISELILETPNADSSLVTSGPTAGGFSIKNIDDSFSDKLESPDNATGPGMFTFHDVTITVPEGRGVTLIARYKDTDRYVSTYSAHGYYGQTKISFYAVQLQSGDYALGYAAKTGNNGTTGTFNGTISYLVGSSVVAESPKQEVKVKWNRPADKKALDTLYNIVVNTNESDSQSGGGVDF